MSSLYSYKTIFSIDSIPALDDFWSFLIFRLNLEQSQYTYDRFARLYNLLSEHKKKLSPHDVVYIILEESSEKFFISIDTTITELLERITSRLDALHFSYLYESNLLSYTINKKQVAPNDNTTNPSSLKMHNYTFMDPQDLHVMRNILEKMSIKNTLKSTQPLTLEELHEFKSTFALCSTHLKYYPQLSVVNNIVAELSVLLSLYMHEALPLGNDFRLLLSSFLNNLIHWQDNLFAKGSEKINFMDKTFQTNLSQIKRSLKLYDEVSTSDEDSFIDDIYDF